MVSSYLGTIGGGLAGAVVWDLFAGSGALGIEALSRGAAHASFVDSARAAVTAVRANLARLGYGPERAQVSCAEVLRWAHGLAGPAGGPTTKPDLVLADPPYAWHSWPALLEALAPLRPLVVIESGGSLELPTGWAVVRQRSYGGSLVTLASSEAGLGASGHL